MTNDKTSSPQDPGPGEAPLPNGRNDPKYTQKLAERLSLISEIARTSLFKLEVGDLLNSIAAAVHQHFGFYDVSIFLNDPDANQCVLVAQSGDFRPQNIQGYRQELGAGIVGWVAQQGKTLLVNDTSKEPRHIVAFPGEEHSLSELTVPIRLHDHTVGVINIENQEANAFDECDAMAIETLAEQVAQAIANAQLFERTRLLRDLNRSIIDAMPSGLSVIDDSFKVLYLNPACTEMFSRDKAVAIGADVNHVFPEEFLKDTGIDAAIDGAFREGQSRAFTELRFGAGPVERILNVRVTPAQMPEGPGVLLMFEDVTEWRKAAALAKERLRHIELIVSHVPVAIVSWDLKNRFTFWGSGATSLFGYTREEAYANRTARELFDDPEDLHRLVEQCHDKPGAEEKLLVRRKDGARVPALVIFGKLLDSAAHHVGHTAIVIDLTEQQRAEDEILREKQKLENVVRVIGAGLALFDQKRICAWANQTVRDWFGHDQELEGMHCHDIYCPRDQQCANCPINECFATREKRKTEMTIMRADGVARRYRHAFAPVFDPSGNVNLVLMVTLDVTNDTKQLYQLSRLRQLGELMQGVLDLDRLLGFILTCITAGQALGFNRALLLLTDHDRYLISGRMGVGPASAEEAGRIWTEIGEKAVTLEDLLARLDYNPETPSAMDRIAQSISVSLDDTNHIVTQCALNRTPMLVENTATDPRVSKEFSELIGADQFVLVPLIARNETIGVVIADNRYTSEPLTEENLEQLSMFANQAAIAIENAESYERLEEEKGHLEQAYRELAEAQDKLVRSERLVAIGRMAAHMAHEIRNPLVNIGGFASAMSRRKDMPRDEIARYSDIIASEVRRLEDILARVMDFSKPPMPLMRAGDISAVVLDTLDQLRNRAKEQNVEILTRLPQEETIIYFDPDQIKQVFLNLFQNALDAMKDGGQLEIALQLQQENMTLVVRDTGRLIIPEDMANLFEPFFSTKPGGTGLGLTVSQKIIHDHGGDIRATSGMERGTEFTIILPLRREPDASMGYRPPQAHN